MRYRMTDASPHVLTVAATGDKDREVAKEALKNKPATTLQPSAILDLGKAAVPIKHAFLVPVDPEAIECSLRVGGPGAQPIAATLT